MVPFSTSDVLIEIDLPRNELVLLAGCRSGRYRLLTGLYAEVMSRSLRPSRYWIAQLNLRVHQLVMVLPAPYCMQSRFLEFHVAVALPEARWLVAAAYSILEKKCRGRPPDGGLKDKIKRQAMLKAKD